MGGETYASVVAAIAVGCDVAALTVAFPVVDKLVRGSVVFCSVCLGAGKLGRGSGTGGFTNRQDGSKKREASRSA